LLAVLVAFGNDFGAAAEIFQLEVKDGKFDRRNGVALFAERRDRVENVTGDKRFRLLPGFVRVATKRQQPIKNDPPCSSSATWIFAH
jgi:hypothetical protein